MVNIQKTGQPITYNFFNQFGETAQQRYRAIVIHSIFFARFKYWNNFGNFKLLRNNPGSKRMFKNVA